jgi:hypothetical protein
VCFLYYPSESEESFIFIFKSLREECFKPELGFPTPPLPHVILGNQAAGLIAAVPKAFPNCQIQHCDWHTVEAIKIKYRKNSYKKAEIKNEFKNNKKIIFRLANYSW